MSKKEAGFEVFFAKKIRQIHFGLRSNLNNDDIISA